MRTLRRRLAGLAALLLIAGIILGLPIVLLALGANPLDVALPSLSDVTEALTTPDDGTLALGAVMVVAWLVWAFLTVSLIVEIIARLRGIRAPHLRGLRLSQNAARGLVGAAVTLFVTVPVAAHAHPAIASTNTAIEPAPVATISAPVNPADAAPATAPEPPPSDAAQVSPATVEHTVAPNESLWSIAKERLGDGHRFKEIVALNTDVLVGGKADFVKPGWVLRIPAPPEPPAAEVAPASETVTVEPGDTLSEIARDELGDADRYPEIFEASRDIEQPGGARLVDPDLIKPGWTLTIPAEAAAPDAQVADPAVAPEAEAPSQSPADAAAAPPPHQAPDPDPTSTATTPPAPQAATPAAEAPASVTEPSGADSEQDELAAGTESDDGLNEAVPWQTATAAGVGTILAAAVLAVVAQRRRTQQRLRRPGQPMPLPDGATADFEQEIRAAADPLSLETVDIALRSLAHHCTQAEQPLPTVRAARLLADRFELYLEDDAHLPAPWTATVEATVWTLPAAAIDDLPPVDRDAVLAPYPALVTIGHDDEDAHVLLNLEHLGALAITGDDPGTREILAALAVELATSTWADDLQVTLVGAFPELEDSLQTGRIRYLPTVGRLVDQLTARAREDREALAAAGVPDLYTARSARVLLDAWFPEIVLLAGNVNDRERAQLAALVAEMPHVAMAFVTAGQAVGEWTLEDVPGTDRMILSPAGVELRPQRLPMDQYGHLLYLAALTDIEELDGDVPDEPTVAEIDAIVAATPPVVDQDDALDATSTAPTEEAAAPRILLLGTADLAGATEKVEPSRRARLVEYAAYLALHPQATAAAIDDAIWPDRRSEDNTNTRNTATSKLRHWVGTDENGDDYLPRTHAGGGYTFTDAVTTDIGQWNQLVAGDPLNAPTENLEAALQLVRGMPFDGVHRKRYAWAENLKQRLIAEIVDASHTLAKRRLMEGRWRAADAAAAVGLNVEPVQESLWRLRILAAHESGNPVLEAEAIEWLLVATEELGCDLEHETEQLLAALKNPGADFNRLMAHAL